MKGRHLLYGTIVAVACFIAGLFVSRLLIAQDKPTASQWRYKAVDLQVEILSDKDGKPVDLFLAVDASAMQGRLEEILAKHGAGGWELVSYSGGTAVYKQGMNRSSR